VPSIERISAVTLAVANMARSVRFYRALGFRLAHGGEAADFTTFDVGAGHLNLDTDGARPRQEFWGRIIFYVDDVDAMYAHVCSLGLEPTTAPRDAAWGERYFHLNDPDGHELSFARPLPGR
jgi:catechol 2,3-dioxygenase-like lactoylglutathione lyase family enzyme